MRDKAAAVLDVAWFGAAIVWSFTNASLALVSAVAALLLRGVLWLLDRRGHTELPERPSWRYWTEPNIVEAERWSVTYWGVLTMALALLAVARFLLGLQWDDMRGFAVSPTFATLAAWGWWNAVQAGEPERGADGREHA